MVSGMYLILFLQLGLTFCESRDIKYKTKIWSRFEKNLFASTLGASKKRLVIGASANHTWGTQGTLKVYDTKRMREQSRPWREIYLVKAIHDGDDHGYGKTFAMNSDFLAVGSTSEERFLTPPSIDIHTLRWPYNMVAVITLDQLRDHTVCSMAISDNSTIVLGIRALNPDSEDGTTDQVRVYRKNGEKSWTMAAKWYYNVTEHDEYQKIATLGISSNFIVVTVKTGYFHFHFHFHSVYLYHYEGEHWVHTQTLLPPGEPYGVYFGDMLSIQNNRLAQTALDETDKTAPKGLTFLYQLQESTQTWELDGVIVSPSEVVIGLQNDTLAVAEKFTNTSTLTKIYKRERNGAWVEFAKLTDKPIFDHNPRANYTSRVCVQDGLVFTGRVNTEGKGVVFVHDISKRSTPSAANVRFGWTQLYVSWILALMSFLVLRA